METKLNKKLPRGYLSASALKLWRENPKKYIEKYAYGEEGESNQYMDLGKRVADALESGKSEDEEISLLITALPPYPKREFELWGELKDGREIIPLFAKLDGYNPFTEVIGEIKTGTKYTQKMATELFQLRFYNMLHMVKFGKPARKLFLHWAETRLDEDGQVEITGAIQTFEVQHSYAELVREMIRVKKDYKAISEAYAKELSKIK